MDGKYHYIVLFHHNRHLLSPVLSHYMEFSSSHGYHTSSYSSVKFSRVSRASRLVRLRLRLGLGLGFVSVMRKCGRVHFAVILESEVARLKIRGPHRNAFNQSIYLLITSQHKMTIKHKCESKTYKAQ